MIFLPSDEDIQQLIRRIDHILDFDDPAELSDAQKLGNTIPASFATDDQTQKHST